MNLSNDLTAEPSTIEEIDVCLCLTTYRMSWVCCCTCQQIMFCRNISVLELVGTINSLHSIVCIIRNSAIVSTKRYLLAVNLFKHIYKISPLIEYNSQYCIYLTKSISDGRKVVYVSKKIGCDVSEQISIPNGKTWNVFQCNSIF